MTSDNISTYDDKKNKILNEVLNNFKNAKNISYKTKGSIIAISYLLDGNTITHKYNTVKGVFLDGQDK